MALIGPGRPGSRRLFLRVTRTAKLRARTSEVDPGANILGAAPMYAIGSKPMRRRLRSLPDKRGGRPTCRRGRALPMKKRARRQRLSVRVGAMVAELSL
jgi:hypothetical protein